jgi:hypothetical protein
MVSGLSSKRRRRNPKNGDFSNFNGPIFTIEKFEQHPEDAVVNTITSLNSINALFFDKIAQHLPLTGLTHQL